MSYKSSEMMTLIDVFYVAPQAHRIVNVAFHWEYSPSIVFIFSQGRKDLYHV
jgi:predicted nicotinamide N-methyase